MPLVIDPTETFLYDMGLDAGGRRILTRLAQRRFGPLPAWAEARIKKLKEEPLEETSLRVLDASSLEDLLGPAT